MEGLRKSQSVSTGNDIQQQAVPAVGEEIEKSHEGVKVLYDSSSAPSIQKNMSSSDTFSSSARFRYPEFLPIPHIPWRNPIKEKLERRDMLVRRSQISIPEFYVGCVLRVIRSNIHQPDKTSEFVGICINRGDTGLHATFTLRNVIDNLGVDLKYNLYDPTIRGIEVLRFERRLDDDLGYLKDAYPEYSTFPLDMKAEVRRDDRVPLNPIKVKLKPRPWIMNWHKLHLKGVEGIESLLSKKMILKHKKFIKPWEKYDLIQEYRRTIPEEEQMEIYSEIKDDLKKLEEQNFRKGRN